MPKQTKSPPPFLPGPPRRSGVEVLGRINREGAQSLLDSWRRPDGRKLRDLIEDPLTDLRRAAVTFFGELGGWAYDTWADHNRRYFAGKLVPGPILWGLTPHGHRLGAYHAERNTITLHPSLIRPRSDAWRIGDLLGERYASDVLLHEMMHQKVHQLDGYAGGESHNCEPWCAEVNRLARRLKLRGKAKPIRQKRVDGKVVWYVEPGHLTRAEIAAWPHSVRPAGYYEADTAELRRQQRNAE